MSILAQGVYPLGIVGAIVDSTSTILLLTYSDEAEELGVSKYLHDKFGVDRGQFLHFICLQIPLVILGVFVAKHFFSVPFASLLVGAYLGFAVKQLQNGIDVRKVFLRRTHSLERS